MASYKEFVAIVDDLLGEIKSANPSRDSQEWYLSNHLSKLADNCNRSSNASEVSNSVKSLVRFATDSLDWNSEISNKVIQISEYHSGLIKGRK